MRYLILLLLLLSGCITPANSGKSGTILIYQPHIPNVSFFYYLNGQNILVEAQINKEYYRGEIYKVNAMGLAHLSSALNNSVLRMTGGTGRLVECYISHPSASVSAKGGSGSCYERGQRVYDIILNPAKKYKTRKTPFSFFKLLQL